MITIGICELGGGVSCDSGVTIGKVDITNDEYHPFPVAKFQLIVLPCLKMANVRQCAAALHGALRFLCHLIIHRQPNSSQRPTTPANLPLSRESEINSQQLLRNFKAILIHSWLIGCKLIVVVSLSALRQDLEFYRNHDFLGQRLFLIPF